MYVSKEKPSLDQRVSGLGNKEGIKVKLAKGRGPNVIPVKSPVVPAIDANGKSSAVAEDKGVLLGVNVPKKPISPTIIDAEVVPASMTRIASDPTNEFFISNLLRTWIL